jgi:alkanesulfonate monooxygenase SsuD/methylene tetrahydromethanopterin reductase-like flavin-dependent oxidoreductase (luciferase family)
LRLEQPRAAADRYRQLLAETTTAALAQLCRASVARAVDTSARSCRSLHTLDYWVELAKLLERGKFDALFLADVLGVYDVFRGSPDGAIANSVQVPVNDPLLLIPAMAYVTRNLGFGVTCAVSYEHPDTLARRFSTLDHLTGGRIGWNVVTGYLNSAAKGIGLARQPERDTRYEIAEEYMQIVYKLWEGSWEDGAVLRDRHPGGHR